MGSQSEWRRNVRIPRYRDSRRRKHRGLFLQPRQDAGLSRGGRNHADERWLLYRRTNPPAYLRDARRDRALHDGRQRSHGDERRDLHGTHHAHTASQCKGRNRHQDARLPRGACAFRSEDTHIPPERECRAQDAARHRFQRRRRAEFLRPARNYIRCRRHSNERQRMGEWRATNLEHPGHSRRPCGTQGDCGMVLP